jgi:diketogulonate reductase-like aldo/keto reductase
MIDLPLTGFGTWRLREPQLSEAIREAVRVGYRHFDGAAIYENEAELGKVFEELLNDEKSIKREEVIK